NDPAVRAGLAAEGISIPDDTWFLGALHDTTTDEITIFDRDAVPASQQDVLVLLDGALREAAALARNERAKLLHLSDSGDVHAAIERRTRDWSQVRPEWGLAGNAAFIAAPRARTRGIDLSGRAFLHDYTWQDDDGWSVLESILTAPMVVASWINLQYYGSAVNPEAFGSGNKVLHNVVGTLGVLEGNGGDLRVGLPWQSLHDGTTYIHEPMKLSVVVEAPIEPIDTLIAKHESVRDLVENGWLHLVAIDESGGASRYLGHGAWERVAQG
ncbi:MAG: putative inorganic carbon transporter subunit DabA, partial [Polyangiales bacterium]